MLSIRKIIPSDAHLINAYWAQNTDADLERMGELTRPDPAENIAFIEHFCTTPFDPRTAEEDLRIWCVGDKAIGYSTLKEIRFGCDARMHLHSWDLAERRKGYGAVLFCLSALAFYESFQLQAIYCEPKADNPMPNGLLRKVGMPCVGSSTYIRVDGSQSVASRYYIQHKIAQAYCTAILA